MMVGRTNPVLWMAIAILMLLHFPVEARFGRHDAQLPPVPQQQDAQIQVKRFRLLRRSRQENDDKEELIIPEINNEESNDSALTWDTCLDVSTCIATALYGSLLIFYGRLCKGQILIMTVMRASGYSKLEQALTEWRRNLRQAIRSAVYNAPSLLLARRALKDLHDRKEMAHKILQETKEARLDGVVTRREHRQIRRLQKRQVRSIRRDVRRLKRGSSAIARVWDTLDLGEIEDILSKVVFSITAVLASGSSNSFIGKAVTLYCHWLSLGSILMETNYKVGMPLSKLILKSTIEPVLRERQQEQEDEPSQLRLILGTMLMYLFSAILISLPNKLGIKMNAALVASTLVIRGLSNLLNRENDEGRKPVPQSRLSVILHRGKHDAEEDEARGYLREFWGGVWTLVLAMLALYCGNLVDEGTLVAPTWFDPFLEVEKAIAKIVTVADKF